MNEIIKIYSKDGQIIEKFETYGIKVIQEYSHVLDFEIKEIVGELSDSGLWLYTIAGAANNMDTTTNFDEGEMFLHGGIKWDGCSNWDFHTDECMMHFCGRHNATSLGRLLDHLYQITKDRLSTYDVEIAE